MSDLYDFPFQKPAAEPTPQPDVPAAPKDRRTGRGWLWSLFHRGRVDLPFLLLSLLLLAAGLVMLLSASYASSYYETARDGGAGSPMHYFIRQAVFALLGLVAMTAASIVPLSFLRRFSMWGLIVSGGLLLGVLLTGLAGGGAVRWIMIGGQTFQPSELVKAAVILAFADWSCRFGREMGTFRKGFLPFLAVMGLFAVLLMLQPHLSATIIIVGIGMVMMCAGGTRWYFLVGLLLLAFLGFRFLEANEEWLVKLVDKFSYIFDRLDAWRDPMAERQGSGWQILQSLYAVGSGGLLGQGLGQSRQKYLYLPEEHNDYIFAIICEELGFVGASLILLLFAVLILRGFWLALQCRDRFNRLMVVGFTSLLTLQVFLNVAVVTNLLPSTGISLPFFSYGGTALLVQMAEVGLILSASRDIENK